MSPELLADRAVPPARASWPSRCARIAEASDAAGADDSALLREAQYLRALLDVCRAAADSVHEHLETHGVSVDVVFEVDQLRERTHRIELLLTCVISPAPARDVLNLIVELVQTAEARRSVRELLSRHYSLLARKVAERSAETGEQYITRDRGEYRHMLLAALGGGPRAGRHHVPEISRPCGRAVGVLGRLLGRRELRGELRARAAAALHGRDQTAGDDRARDGGEAQRREQRRCGRGFVDEVTHLIRSQAGRHLRQPVRGGTGGARVCNWFGLRLSVRR